MSNDSWKPNLFVAGFAKSGSTALVDYLRQHYDIFVPRIDDPYVGYGKEPYTLSIINDAPLWISEGINNNYIKNHKLSFNEYKNLYLNATLYKYRVDGSQPYTFEKGFAEYLKSFSPDAKVLLIIREQKKRAISAYLFTYSLHKKDFKSWLESHLLPDIDSFLTYPQVVEYYRVFKDNLRVIKNEELNKEPKIVMNNVFRYLGLEPIDIKPLVSNPTMIIPLEDSKDVVLKLILKSLHLAHDILEPIGLLDILRNRFDRIKRNIIYDRYAKAIGKDKIYKEYLNSIPKDIAKILEEDYNKTIEFVTKNNIILGITKTEYS